MTDSNTDSTRPLRLTVYGLLIVVCLGTTLGRLYTVRSPLGGTPMLSANDRSRWATIRSLVEQGTYAIDDVIYREAPYTPHNRDREWYTIDMVRHLGRDGQEHYYSSKPPLLATLLAGEYWAVHRLTGATLGEQPYYVIRLMLITINLLPLALYFVLLARLVERYGRTDWGRVFVMAAAVFGTFLTTFAVTLNNHLPAAVSIMIALYAAAPIWHGESLRIRDFALAGFFSAFAVANELPAMSFAVLLGVVLLWKSPRRTLAAFVPAALVVTIAATFTNYLAHDSWRPPYAHRRNGPLLATVPGSLQTPLDAGQIPTALRDKLAELKLELSPQAGVSCRALDEGWMLWDPTRQLRLALSPSPAGVEVHAWDHWYEFEGSYWASDRKAGVDRGEPSRAAYAFHVLIGHHGIFSLTPVWGLSVVGLGLWLTRRQLSMRGPAVFVLLLTVVCLGFYLWRPLIDRNYGGVTCGFRWVFWFAPMWLLAMLPVADVLAVQRRWRWLGWALLLASVGSASYAPLNPWSHPWLYQYWASLGWIAG